MPAVKLTSGIALEDMSLSLGDHVSAKTHEHHQGDDDHAH
jgi:hypothetical protein